MTVVREREWGKVRGQKGHGENEAKGDDWADVSSDINLQAWLMH